MSQQQFKYYIGIDCGVNTGFAAWDKKGKKLTHVKTLKIHEAMELIKAWIMDRPDTFIRVEDARKRKWFGKSGREQLQGAGSIKRDSKIWEDYLTDLKFQFEMVPPKNNKTKMNTDVFRSITGYAGKTTEHSRDAAMLVYGL